MVVDLEKLARRILADHGRIPSQLCCELLDLTTVQAYGLQAEIARLREQRGERVIGYKVGCTSKVIQEQLGVGEPIFGRIFDAGCFRSGVRLSWKRYANLAVEGELAVRLSNDVSTLSLSEDEILGAIETVFPVIELHHYVLRSSGLSCQELIATNGMHAGLVLANEEAGYSDLSEPAQGLSIRLNDTVVGAVAQPWTMGSPVKLLRWLALHSQGFGLRLTKGQVILTGSPMRLYRVNPGTHIFVEARPFGQCAAEVSP